LHRYLGTRIGTLGAKQDQDLSRLERIIQLREQYSFFTEPDLDNKLRAAQTKAIESPHDKILELSEADYRALCSLMLVTCGAPIILDAISLLNEINWPA
jgi:hypothetical protein